MGDQKLEEAVEERIINSYEVMYMVEMLLLAKRNNHLTDTGIIVGLLRIAARYAEVADSKENFETFLGMAAEIAGRDPAVHCDCSDCIRARAAARDRVKRNWDLELPEEFPATVGSA